MTHEELLRELDSLTPEARRQVEELIAFLRQSHESSAQTGAAVSTDLRAEGFIGMWRDRDDMRDSSAWVRAGREREWAN